MKIVGFASENMASSYLRVRQWMTAMKDRGHDATFHDNGLVELDRFDKRVDGADVVVYGHTHELRKVALVHGGKKVHVYKIICDTDDLITDIPDYNFAQRAYHNATGFKRIGVMQYRLADAITASTAYLRDDVIKYNRNVHLIPNCIDMRLWANVRSRRKEVRDRGDIRIYWGGGGGHWDDVLKLRDPLLRIFAECPQVKLVFSNFVPAWAAALPSSRVFFLPLADYRGLWQKILKWWCIDIGLAPLVCNAFNRAKSHVKWLDYSMAGIAGVYERIDSYESVNDGLTGLLASTPDEWYERINLLIDNPVLRQAIGERARREVASNWTTDVHAAAYERMLYDVCGHKQQSVEVNQLVEGEVVEAQCQLSS